MSTCRHTTAAPAATAALRAAAPGAPALRRLGWRTLAASAAIALAPLAAPASAATVGAEQRTVERCPPTYGGGCERRTEVVETLHFRAAPGEVNDLVVTDAGDEVRFRETGAPLHAGDRCRQEAPDTVVCPDVFREGPVQVLLGDQDDRATVRHVPGIPRIALHGDEGADVLHGQVLDGGPGDDVLHGTATVDALAGGPGADVLAGAAATDELLGGDGDDALSGGDGDDVLHGGPGTDRLDGGAGSGDVVSYARSDEPVRADLLLGVAVQGGVLERPVAVEGVRGGDGDDELRGTDRADQLLGGAGADRVKGLRGDDVLSGGSGSRLDGGPGADVLAVQPGVARASVVCGPGLDRVGTAPGRSPLDRSCERALGELRVQLPPRRLPGGRLGVRLGPCDECPVRLSVARWSSSQGRWLPVGRHRWLRLSERRSQLVAIRLTRGGRRALRRAATLRLRAEVPAHGSDHEDTDVLTAVVRLGRP